MCLQVLYLVGPWRRSLARCLDSSAGSHLALARRKPRDWARQEAGREYKEPVRTLSEIERREAIARSAPRRRPQRPLWLSSAAELPIDRMTAR
jgi:hypothetical protein